MILCSGGLECVGGKVRCRHGILAVVDVFGSDACFVVFVSHSEGAWTFESSHEVLIEKNGTFFVCVCNASICQLHKVSKKKHH